MDLLFLPHPHFCKNSNEQPKDFTLSLQSLAENVPAHTVVGTFNTTDPDSPDFHTYELVEGSGDEDNSAFTIEGNQLRINANPDYELKSNYSIRVRTSDLSGLVIEKVLSVGITNVNEAPTDFSWSANSIAENSAVDTVVATFKTTDPDLSDIHSYSLVEGHGDTDNNAFTIDSNRLLINTPTDFEQKSNYSIRVRTTDANGLFLEKVLSVGVINVNEAPFQIALNNSTVAENSIQSTVIGQLSTTDPDAKDIHSYSLVNDAQGRFGIVGNQLLVADGAILDFEKGNSFDIEINCTDAGGLSTTGQFTISLTDVNEAPTDLTLSPQFIAENSPADTVVGTFSTTDPDLGDAHTYELVSGAFDTDNSAFTIVDNQLHLVSSPDFETQSNYSIRVRTTDAAFLSLEKVLSVGITNVNEAPIQIALSSNTVAENSIQSTVIGQLSTTDPDAKDIHSYSLVNDAQGRFGIVGNQLLVADGAILDFEKGNGFDIEINCTDADGLTTTGQFTISLTDVNEAPTDLTLSPSRIALNSPVNTVVGTFSTTDPDSGDTHTYELVSGAFDTDNSAFTIVDNQLHLVSSPNWGTTENLSIRVRTTDAVGLSLEKVLSVDVTKVNSAPRQINLSNSTVAENSTEGTLIGQLSTTDPNSGDSHSYKLVDNASGRFQIVGNQLQVASGTLLDFEKSHSYNIIVRSTDNGTPNLSLDRIFTIDVANVNEAPSFTSSPVLDVEADKPYTYNIVTRDPDIEDTRTITANTLPSWLNLVDKGDGTATLSGTPGLTDSGFYKIPLKVTDADGETSFQNFVLAVNAELIEGTNFSPVRTLSLSIPAFPSILSFTVDPLVFDSASTDSINDAFEVSLVDADDRSLVHTIAPVQNAFFNWTEGEPIALGAGTTYSASNKTVSLNLTGINPGTPALLVFRLLNNDSDTTTSVRIKDLKIAAAPDGTVPPIQTDFNTASSAGAATAANFNTLVDVSPSFKAEYGSTSFNPNTKELYAQTAIKNLGSYSVNGTLLVAVDHISDPKVSVARPDGYTPEGLPYYNFTNLVADGKLNPNQTTSQGSLVFSNPNKVQFTYDLVVLSELNQNPVIQTKPNLEVIGGQPYKYDVDAKDLDADVLSYKLLVAPKDMTIDAATGLIQWNTAQSNIGNHAVTVQVNDGRGGSAQQTYNLSVIGKPPNRPPIFTSTPVVDAAINKPYHYDAVAVDPDSEPVTYSLSTGPDGMKVNPNTGVVDWTPEPVLTLGDTVIGQIGVPGEVDEFTFSGTAGERIYIDPLQYSGDYSHWKFSVKSPSGLLLNDSNLNENKLLNLTENGNYRIRVLAEVGMW